MGCGGSGALWATDRHCQQAASIAGKRPGRLRVEGLCRREPEQNDDAGCRGVHPPFSSPRVALRLCSDSALRLFSQSQSDEKAGAVPLLTACPSNRRRAQHRDWRTGATPLPTLQGRLVGLDRNTPGRGSRLCGGAHDRGHLMIDPAHPPPSLGLTHQPRQGEAISLSELAVLVFHKHWLLLPTTALVTLPGGRVTFSTDELLHRSALFRVPIQRTAIQYP